MNKCRSRRPSRISTSFEYLGPNLFGPVVPFYPNAPPPMVTPVSPRASPYVVPPQQCTLNLRNGTVTCLSQERAFLDGQIGLQYYQPSFQNFGYGGGGGGGGSWAPGGRTGGYVGQLPQNTNYVYGSEIVDELPDSPLNRVLTRGPVGPWNLVGYIQTDNPANTSSRDRTMMVYAQRQDRGRDRYNYRVTDNNGVPLDVGENEHWKTSGATIQVPGQAHPFQLHLYKNYQ